MKFVNRKFPDNDCIGCTYAILFIYLQDCIACLSVLKI